jgi:hypothetical protein
MVISQSGKFTWLLVTQSVEESLETTYPPKDLEDLKNIKLFRAFVNNKFQLNSTVKLLDELVLEAYPELRDERYRLYRNCFVIVTLEFNFRRYIG